MLGGLWITSGVRADFDIWERGFRHPMDTLDSYWPGILDVVRLRVPQQSFDTWFLPLKAAHKENGILQICCPNRFFMDWFSEHHLLTLNEAASHFFNRPITCQLYVEDGLQKAHEDLFVPPQESARRDLPVTGTTVTTSTPTIHSTASSSGPDRTWPMPPRWRSASGSGSTTIRCSSTVGSGWARPT